MALRLASKGDIVKCGSCRDIFLCLLLEIVGQGVFQIVLIQAHGRRKMVIGKEGECRSISFSLRNIVEK